MMRAGLLVKEGWNRVDVVKDFENFPNQDVLIKATT